MHPTYLFKSVFVCLLLIAASVQVNAQDCTHKGLLKMIDQSMMEKDISMMDKIYHADAVRHTPNGDVEGLEKIKANAAQFYKDVPDAKGENLEIICNENFLVVRWKGTGTPTGSPKPIQVTGITISKVVDGMIAEEWEEMNTMSLMMQMGYELKPPSEDKD